MEQLFDIAKLEADIFSEDELRAIDTYVEAELADEEFPALELELTLEDGRQLICQVIGVFLEGQKEYIALHPIDQEDDQALLMQLVQGTDDSIGLLPIEDETELAAAALAFHRFMDDECLEYEEELEL